MTYGKIFYVPPCFHREPPHLRKEKRGGEKEKKKRAQKILPFTGENKSKGKRKKGKKDLKMVETSPHFPLIRTPQPPAKG